MDIMQIDVHEKYHDLYISDDYIIKEDWERIRYDKKSGLYKPEYVYQKMELAGLDGKDHILRQIIIYCLKGEYSKII